MSLTAKARHRHRAASTGGVAGNERLTAMTGLALLVLFAAEGVTILRVHQLLTVHFLVGMLLVGPVALKVGATLLLTASLACGLLLAAATLHLTARWG